MNLQVGDVVRLNSGSSAMTVAAIDGSTITCVWMTGGVLRRAEFDSVLLTKISGIGG